MNVRILDELCCPVCLGELTLYPFVEESIKYLQHLPTKLEGEEGYSNEYNERVIKEGVLLCQQCKIWYPIYSYVPVMLVFQTYFHRRFAQDYAGRFELLSEYSMPNRLPEPGEKSIQETFTDEWNCVQDNELSFLYSIEDLKLLIKKVLLKWTENSQEELRNILDIGCGLGHESIALQDVSSDAEIFAIDLNFAVLKSGEIFKSRPHIHLIISSLFHLPLRPSSFDLVYSQGVIHHTFSTVKAFESIASYVRSGGRLTIWIYGLGDHLARTVDLGILVRVVYIAECILRPLISRSPKVLRDIFFGMLAIICHPIMKMKVRHKAKWQLENTTHSIRDWLSHKYAHRHTYNEVFEWFEDLGFRIVDVQSPSAYRQLFQKCLWGIGVTGKKL
jgi:SAM-dependent methyltransferase